MDPPNDQRGVFDNCAVPPATIEKWRRDASVGEIADDALTLKFGLMTSGKGAAARLDDVKLEGLGDSPPPDSASALSDRGLASVTELARRLGGVQYFHSSDQAAALTSEEWDRLAVDGVREVEPVGGAGGD